MTDLDDATRADAARTLAVWDAGADVRYERWADTLRALLAAYDALLAERARANALAETWAAKWADTQARYIAAELRAAPVLAAAEVFVTDSSDNNEMALIYAVAAWRAAREGVEGWES